MNRDSGEDGETSAERDAHERGFIEGYEKGLLDPGSAWMQSNADKGSPLAKALRRWARP